MGISPQDHCLTSKPHMQCSSSSNGHPQHQNMWLKVWGGILLKVSQSRLLAPTPHKACTCTVPGVDIHACPLSCFCTTYTIVDIMEVSVPRGVSTWCGYMHACTERPNTACTATCKYRLYCMHTHSSMYVHEYREVSCSTLLWACMYIHTYRCDIVPVEDRWGCKVRAWRRETWFPSLETLCRHSAHQSSLCRCPNRQGNPWTHAKEHDLLQKQKPRGEASAMETSTEFYIIIRFIVQTWDGQHFVYTPQRYTHIRTIYIIYTGMKEFL